jgi:ubiquinone/menaquinone biosynthesis C-methylase UbiE
LKKFPISGRLYDFILEPFLKNTKKKVSEFVFSHNLFPVLDICCGTGVQCYRISQDCSKIIGLDLDSRLIHYAKSKYPSIPFLCADATRIPFKNSSFKGIILSYSLHDKSFDFLSIMLKEVKRILKPEGKIVIVDFDRPWSLMSWIASLYVYGIERIAGKEHFLNGRNFLKQGGLTAFIDRNGLKKIDSCGVELAHTRIVVAQFLNKDISKM